MKIWSAIIIVVLTIAALALGGFLYYQNQITLKTNNNNNLFYTFAVNETPSTEYPPQMRCPEGRVIEVIDAWYEAYDPYFQCTDTPTGCAPATDSDGNILWPNKCPDHKSGQKSTDAWEEITVGENNDINTYKNLYCQYDKDGNPILPSDGNVCVSMNALGYAIGSLNGQKSVTLNLSQFGPNPCSSAISPTDLPVGAIAGQTSDSSTPPYQGTYAHGIYTCVLEDEISKK